MNRLNLVSDASRLCSGMSVEDVQVRAPDMASSHLPPAKRAGFLDMGRPSVQGQQPISLGGGD